MSARTIVFPSEPFEELRTGALQGVPTCKAVIAIVDRRTCPVRAPKYEYRLQYCTVGLKVWALSRTNSNTSIHTARRAKALCILPVLLDMLITQRARSSRAAAAARLVFAPRRLLSAPQGAPASETLAEKNRRLREKSEENLTQSRQRLMEDMSKRNEDMAALREVIHEKTVTLHPPPAALYSQASAFRFPQLEATSLAGDTVILDDNLFAGKWTLFGCAGSRFAQPMVDGWMDGIATALAMSPAPPTRLELRWLSLVEGSLLNWFRRPLLMTMRRAVPAARHGAFLCHFGDSSAPRRRLQMQNRYLGLVCLVDGRGIIRWHVHGSEVPSEPMVSDLMEMVQQEAKRETRRTS